LYEATGPSTIESRKDLRGFFAFLESVDSFGLASADFFDLNRSLKRSLNEVNVHRLNIYLHRYVLKLYREFTSMCAENATLDINASIKKHIKMLKPIFPRRAVISVGDYASQIFLKSSAVCKNDELLTFFIQKTSESASKQKKTSGETKEIISIDEKVDTHYWFNVKKYVAEHDAIVEKLKNKSIDKLDGAILVASIGEGVGSALLPDLAARFKEGNVNAVAFAIMPSSLQPADAHFNALWSVATCAAGGLTQILIDRDALESYVGVDRKGAILKGSSVLSYIVELTLAKEQFTQEFFELSRSFNLKMFTVLAATGASLKVYGSIQNILETALLRPFTQFDISTATMLYVLVRAPLKMKEQLTQSQIELSTEAWFSGKTKLKVVKVSAPIYADDGSDRIDIALFVGGFDLIDMVTSEDRKTSGVKSYAAKNGFIKGKEWQELIESLTT
jgi:hypothetical protein